MSALRTAFHFTVFLGLCVAPVKDGSDLSLRGWVENDGVNLYFAFEEDLDEAISEHHSGNCYNS